MLTLLSLVLVLQDSPEQAAQGFLPTYQKLWEASNPKQKPPEFSLGVPFQVFALEDEKVPENPDSIIFPVLHDKEVGGMIELHRDRRLRKWRALGYGAPSYIRILEKGRKDFSRKLQKELDKVDLLEYRSNSVRVVGFRNEGKFYPLFDTDPQYMNIIKGEIIPEQELLRKIRQHGGRRERTGRKGP